MGVKTIIEFRTEKKNSDNGIKFIIVNMILCELKWRCPKPSLFSIEVQLVCVDSRALEKRKTKLMW